jgi:branched-chain amino acid transport system substrate-binding protein
MAQALLGLKAAYEKAQRASAQRPTQDQIIAAFEHLTFEAPGGTVEMALGKGHQAVMGAAVGVTKNVGGELKIIDVKHYTTDEVNPPEGVKSADWIKSGFQAK